MTKHKFKTKAELTSFVHARIESGDMESAYAALELGGGLGRLVDAEKVVYRNWIRKRRLSEAKRKTPVSKKELGLRKKLFDQKLLKIGGRSILLCFEELSTKAIRSSIAPGGSIDLVGYDTKNGRIYIIELKHSDSRESLLEGLVQASIYRAQLPALKSLILHHKDCPELLKNLSKWSYGVLVMAPKEWPSFKAEAAKAGKLLKRESRRASLFGVVELRMEMGAWAGEWKAGKPKSY